MANKPNGGGAYPSTVTITGPADDPFTGKHVPEGRTEVNINLGMSLRDYFASKAMAGICAHPDTWGLLAKGIAESAYELADAMLAARGES